MSRRLLAVGGQGRYPEISRFKKNTNFLRGRTFRIRPPGPKKSGPDPRIPEKSGPDPRNPGIRGLDPRKPGFPAEMDQILGKRPFSRFPGGPEKVKSCPMTPGLFQKTTDYNLCHPHGNCAFFHGFWTSGGVIFPSLGFGSLDPYGTKADKWPFFKCWGQSESGLCKAAWNPPESAISHFFRVSGGPDRLFGVPGPGIRENGRFPRIWGSGSGKLGSGRPGNGDPGSKKSRTGTPLPGTVRSENPGARDRKKVDPTPKKKSSPKKKRPGHITNPPLPTTIGHS